jgi:hypothetical protein
VCPFHRPQHSGRQIALHGALQRLLIDHQERSEEAVIRRKPEDGVLVALCSQNPTTRQKLVRVILLLIFRAFLRRSWFISGDGFSLGLRLVSFILEATAVRKQAAGLELGCWY